LFLSPECHGVHSAQSTRPKIFAKFVQPSKARKSGSGRPPKSLISSLIVKYTHADTGKDYYGCVAKGCHWYRAGNAQVSRILKHTISCRYLSGNLKELAKDYAAQSSLGAALDSSMTSSATTADLSTGSIKHAPSKTTAVLSKKSLVLDFTNAGRKELQAKLDHSIMKLICVAGLVPHVLDSPEWKEFMAIANPKYHPTPSDKFEDVIIPNEAAFVRKQVTEILQKEENLTLTFDGNSTRKPQSIYTVHVTTKNRDSYFVDGYEGSDERHTAAWVKDKVLKVFPSPACSHTSAYLSKSSHRPSRRSARRNLQLCVQTAPEIPKKVVKSYMRKCEQ
jgi:hypothetical protein